MYFLSRRETVFFLKIADLTVKIDNRYRFVERFAEGYTIPPVDTPDIEILITEDDLANEPPPEDGAAPPYFLESTAVYRKIAEKLPPYDAFVMHGSVIAVDGKAYIFTARSGVGKTTHTRLWLERFADKAHVLNGDKPIIRFFDGVPYACGTPWRGKENYGINEMLPLAGIVFFGRGTENRAYPMEKEKAFFALSSQIYRSRDKDHVIKTLALTDRLLNSTKLIAAECNMDIEAADVVYRALVSDND